MGMTIRDIGPEVTAGGDGGRSLSFIIPQLTRGSGERRNLPQRGLGRISTENDAWTCDCVRF